MPQVFWKYKNPIGKDYEVSLYHGDSSGHVLIYSGKEIIKIDFSVKSDRTYSFMLGDELFDVQLRFTENKIIYNLLNSDKNTFIDTLNKRNYPTYHFIKALLFFIFAIVFIILIWFLL